MTNLCSECGGELVPASAMSILGRPPAVKIGENVIVRIGDTDYDAVVDGVTTDSVVLQIVSEKKA